MALRLTSHRVVNQYHRAMTLESFMKTTAAVAWPEHQRHMYCYHFDQTKPVNCRTKQGNPFGPFWDAFHVNFVGDRGIDYGMSPVRWSTELAPQQHPVVAMPGAPARFPVQPEHRELAQYVEWSDSFAAQKQDIVSSMQGPILAAHIRAGYGSVLLMHDALPLYGMCELTTRAARTGATRAAAHMACGATCPRRSAHTCRPSPT